jgi:hypothetical protein
MVPALSARAAMPIERGNAMMDLGTSSSGSLIGPVLFGVLVSVFSAAFTLFVDVATLAVAIVLIGLFIAPLPRVQRSQNAEKTSYLWELLDGASHIFNDRVLRAVVPVFMAPNFVHAPSW